MTSAKSHVASPTQRSRFLDALSTRVLVSDGAMGTMLQERGVPMDACLDKVNLDQPALVRDLHLEYIEAGADLIQTNTFGANRVRLAAYGLEDQVVEINRRAVEIAHEAVASKGNTVLIAGDLGPLGAEVSDEEARAAFEEQARALSEAGVDLILLQTFTSLAEAVIAVQAVRRVASETPVVAEMTFLANRRTVDGQDPVSAARALQAAGADVIGANCGDGPAQVLRILREMAVVPGLKLIAQPSAGRPTLVQRRVVYAASAEYLADYAQRFVQAGALIVGGCCGTSPRHIAAIRQTLDRRTEPRIEVVTPEASPEEGVSAPNSLRAKLAAGHFVVNVEVDPPRGMSTRSTLDGARLVLEAGADCVNIGDSPMADVRMSAIAMGALLREEVGAEPIIHCSTRDRNLMALQSDLMGAHALGIRNVLCIKGDPHALGRYTNAMAVWDVNALGLMRILKGFNAGHDALDNAVSPATRFFVGAAVNPSAEDLDAEAKLVRNKVKAGADFFISQAIFDTEPLERLLEKIGPERPPIIVGVWPVHTLKQVDFLNEHIMPVPAWLHDEIERAGPSAEQRGFELANVLLEKVRPLAQGVYLIPSFGRFTGVAELVVAARELADRRA